jgi:hypothetical protein
MTRINVVPPEELCRQHLTAEYRELPRIYAYVHKYVEKDMMPNIPDEYVLGKGHVMFFADKLIFINRRHKALIDEMLRRGYKPTYTKEQADKMLDGITTQFLNDYEPTPDALSINRSRILERMPCLFAQKS